MQEKCMTCGGHMHAAWIPVTHLDLCTNTLEHRQYFELVQRKKAREQSTDSN